MSKKTVNIFLLLGCVASFAIAQENLLTNGGFEKEGNPDYGWLWSYNNDDGAVAEWSIDSTPGEAYEGKNLYRINVTEVSADNWHVQLKDPTWVAKLGYVYEFSFYGKAEAPHAAAISVYGGPDGKDAWRTTTSIDFTTEWTKFTQIFTADKEGPGVHNFAIVVGSEAGVYDIDNAVIIEKEPTENMYPNGSFEADGAGWNLWQQADDDGNPLTDVTIEYVEDATAPEGSKVCKITVDKIAYDEDSAVVNWYAQLQDGSWTADSGWEYTFTFYAKADSELTIHVCTGAGSTRDYEYLDGADYVIGDEWMDQTFTYTSEISGSDSVNFNIYVAGETGTLYLDNISLVGTEPAIGTITPQRSSTLRSQAYAVKVLPEHLRLVASDKLDQASIVSVYSIAGRLFAAKPVHTAGHSFDLPKPPSGSWIVRVNNDNAASVVIP